MHKLIALFFFAFCIYSCAPKERNVDKKEWGKVFEKHGAQNGCIEVMDNNHEMIYYYNLERVSLPMSPASTFKIFNSLVALETGIAPNEKMIIPYDGKPVWNPDWKKDMDMTEAFKVSSLPYYQELARRIGKDEMQKYLDTCDYGNHKIGPKIDEFWIDNSLLISPDEQVGFMHHLYFDKLPFSQRTHRIVRQLMVQEDSLKRKEKPYLLSYKTGTSVQSDGYNCWLVGYLEDAQNNAHPYFFALNITLPKSTEIGQTKVIRLAILKEVLHSMNLF